MCLETTTDKSLATHKTTDIPSRLSELNRAELIDLIYELQARVSFLETCQGLGWRDWTLENKKQTGEENGTIEARTDAGDPRVTVAQQRNEKGF